MNLLNQSIESCSKIQRKKKVLSILNKNDIYDLYDLRNNPIPFNGLTDNEIRQLQIMKDQLMLMQGMKTSSQNTLYILLGKHASRHEQTRIYNILKSNKITSLQLLCSTSDKKLALLYGIGPKSMGILKAVKQRFRE